MELIFLVDEDFVNYKRPSMFIGMPHCSFKCDHEFGTTICQNWPLRNEPLVSIGAWDLINRYKSNPITEAIVFGGLEPFDSVNDLSTFITFFRYDYNDDIVIYTGYTEEEVKAKFDWIYEYNNIIIKYGRYKPDEEPHYDEVLGVNLASDNQYAIKYNEVDYETSN